MIEFGQGATIGFFIEGDNVINLDTNDFKVLYYKKNMVERAIFNKSDLTFISTNKYYGEISSETTATMAKGVYIQEILLGANYKSVSKDEAFNLFETEIR